MIKELAQKLGFVRQVDNSVEGRMERLLNWHMLKRESPAEELIKRQLIKESEAGYELTEFGRATMFWVDITDYCYKNDCGYQNVSYKVMDRLARKYGFEDPIILSRRYHFLEMRNIP
jgi:hypothetical protein